MFGGVVFGGVGFHETNAAGPYRMSLSDGWFNTSSLQHV